MLRQSRKRTFYCSSAGSHKFLSKTIGASGRSRPTTVAVKFLRYNVFVYYLQGGDVLTNVAILGFGTVGSGVYEILKILKKVLAFSKKMCYYIKARERGMRR